MTAEELLAQRFTALDAGDFGTVYDTYHLDAPFTQQFADRDLYLQFAQQQLGSIKVDNWQSLRQRQVDAHQQQHLLVMKLSVDGSSQYFYELALLIDTPAGWRYHSAQKLGTEDYSGLPEQIQFAHFDQVEQKICY